MAARQFVYHMRGLTKAYPGGKKVLENINLSFYPEAKIGVLGVNGSGKSTLMRIMAGIDTEFVGEGFVAEGARVGYLPQEPPLDPALDVRGNVMLGVKDKQDLLDRYNELAMNYSDETADEMTRLQDADRGQGPVGSRQSGRAGDGRARLPARRRRSDKAVGRRTAPRRAVPAAARTAGAAAARRADQPSRCRDGQLARRAPAQLSRRDPDRHPRPLFSRQRDGLDSRARPRPRHSLRGQLLGLVEGPSRNGSSRRRAKKLRAHARSPRRPSGSPLRPRRGRPRTRRASRATRTSSTNRTTRWPNGAQIVIPVAERLGNNVIDFEGLSKGSAISC